MTAFVSEAFLKENVSIMQNLAQFYKLWLLCSHCHKEDDRPTIDQNHFMKTNYALLLSRFHWTFTYNRVIVFLRQESFEKSTRRCSYVSFISNPHLLLRRRLGEYFQVNLCSVDINILRDPPARTLELSVDAKTLENLFHEKLVVNNWRKQFCRFKSFPLH